MKTERDNSSKSSTTSESRDSTIITLASDSQIAENNNYNGFDDSASMVLSSTITNDTKSSMPLSECHKNEKEPVSNFEGCECFLSHCITNNEPLRLPFESTMEWIHSMFEAKAAASSKSSCVSSSIINLNESEDSSDGCSYPNLLSRIVRENITPENEYCASSIINLSEIEDSSDGSLLSASTLSNVKTPPARPPSLVHPKVARRNILAAMAARAMENDNVNTNHTNGLPYHTTNSEYANNPEKCKRMFKYQKNFGIPAGYQLNSLDTFGGLTKKN